MTFAEAKEVRLQRASRHAFLWRCSRSTLQTGEQKIIHRSTDWLNHLQFSPTGSAARLMFCHEGPWHKVDRIWTIRTDGAEPQLVHTRTMNMEIAGHEFFSRDGKTIWYDLQTPRGEVFWLARRELATAASDAGITSSATTGRCTSTSSPDGKLFAGDGGDAEHGRARARTASGSTCSARSACRTSRASPRRMPRT